MDTKHLRTVIVAATAAATLTWSLGTFAQNGAVPNDEESAANTNGYGPGMMGYGYPGAMGPGAGYGMMGGYGGYGPGMMGGYGGGYGPGMMGPGMMGGYGPGMMGGGYGGPGMMGAYGPGGFGNLNLSNDQQKKIAQIQENTRKKNWDLMGKLQEEHANLQNLFAEETPDSNKVGAEYDRLAGLRKQILQNNLQAHNQIQSVLTKEQRDQLQQWRGGMMGGPGYGSRGMMPRGQMQQQRSQ